MDHSDWKLMNIVSVKCLIEASIDVRLMVWINCCVNWMLQEYVYLDKAIFCGHVFGSVGPKGVINDWRRFKLDNVDQTVPQSKRELLRQMSSPREDDKERLTRKVDVNTHRTSHTGKHTIDRFYSLRQDDSTTTAQICQKHKMMCRNRRRVSKSQMGESIHRQSLDI